MFFLFAFLFYLLFYFLKPEPFVNTYHKNKFGHRIAHRCGKHIYPENTLFACKEVYQNNLADVLELDVHLTKDNQLIVIHDAKLDRTTNLQGEVKNYNYAEIQNLDAAYHFKNEKNESIYRNKNIRIEKLETFFREIPKGKFYIELKVKEEIAIQILLELIEKYKKSDEVLIGSVKEEVNKKIISQSKDRILVFLGLTEFLKWYFLYLINLQDYYPLKNRVITLPNFPFLITSNLINTCKFYGLRLDLFTINEKDELRKWIELGVDGVMTDNPNLFLHP